MMAGTLLLLREASAELHFWNLSRGDCGPTTHSRDEIVRLRHEEAQAAAALAGATLHPSLFDDFRIFYDEPSLRRVAAVVRSIRPTLILTHSPEDYMEDHQNAARLVVTAAFSRAAPNFPTEPAARPTTRRSRFITLSPTVCTMPCAGPCGRISA